ncbi:MAG: RNA polymerase sigma factor [Beijerinckiaceae bacterium]
MTAPGQVSGANAVLSHIARHDRGRILSVLIAKFRSFDLAEEALQDALTAAHENWAANGLPASPQGWLVTTASRRILDRIRKEKRDGLAHDDIAARMQHSEDDTDEISDERLRLIFTCCHPALDEKSRVALTLRTLGGLTTPEIARAFLDAETTMGQRLSRAKAKIEKARIPYVVPGPEEWPERLRSVLSVIYLIFNEGYFASSGDVPLRQLLCEEAIFLAGMVDQLRPDEPEVLGLLALLLTTHARRRARLSGAGVVPLEAQDRMLWDTAQLEEADALLLRAMEMRQAGPYQIQAAIAQLHSTVGDKDWRQIALLYDSLLRFGDNPVVRLNRAVAMAEAGALEPAIGELTALTEALDHYQPFHAAQADLLAKSGQRDAAIASYDRAIGMAATAADAAFLRGRRNGLSG